MTGIRGCGECHMGEPCNGCGTCLPRYLCANCVVTPGPNASAQPPYPFGPLCCQDMEFRLGGGTPAVYSIDPQTLKGVWHYIDGAVCGWSGQGTCRNASAKYGLFQPPPSLFVAVDIHKDVNGVCYTEISAPDILPYPIQVDGVMGKNFCTYTFSGDSVSNGSHIVVTLTVAGVVPNKSAGMKCSPCVCGTCVSSSYCVMLFVPARNFYGVDPVCNGFWDCHTLTCAPSTDPTVPQQWSDKTGQPFEIGPPGHKIPWSITMHTPSQAELDAGYSTCAIIARVSVLDTGQYTTAIPPAAVGYNEITVLLDSGAFSAADDTIPPIGTVCKETIGDHALTRGSGGPTGTPKLNITGFKTISLTDQDAFTLRDLAGDTDIGQIWIRESCCGQPCIPDVSKCWTGCLELGINYKQLPKCAPITLYATCIAPGNSFDGFVIPISTYDPTNIAGSYGFTGFTANFCMQFFGAGQPPSNRAGTLGSINFAIGLGYYDVADCEGPKPDAPGEYRLAYALGDNNCASTGLPAMICNCNMTPTLNAGTAPTYASCVPFRLDFPMPPICSGNPGGAGVGSTQPYSVGDAGGTWTLRITQ